VSTESFWGDLGNLEDVKTPGSHLREQAEVLTRETKGLLVGQVHQVPQGDQISVELNIVVPALSDYRWNVLRVLHPLAIYPLEVQESQTYEWQKCPDEAAFLATLKAILSSPKVRKAIATLLAQSKI